VKAKERYNFFIVDMIKFKRDNGLGGSRNQVILSGRRRLWDVVDK
jgi:hypothetical protein